MGGVDGGTLPAIFQSIGTAVVSAILGFLGAIAVFRSRFDVESTKREALAEQIARDRVHDRELISQKLEQVSKALEDYCGRGDDYFRSIDRRQKVSLDLLSDLARKNGVVHRALGSDAIARAITDDQSPEGDR
jgi:hypothetical protein